MGADLFRVHSLSDICPEELEKLAEVTETLRKQKTDGKHSFQPLFVSVDPDRDTPELISKYIKDYSPHFIGLTGTREQIGEMCKHYRSTSAKVQRLATITSSIMPSSCT